MGLESASPIFITDLNTLWPLGGDDRSTSDDHHRVIKAALKNTLPELSSTVSANPAELNLLSGYPGAALPAHNTEHAWTQQQYFAEYSLSDSVSVNWDLQIAQTALIKLTGSQALVNPTNMQAGSTYVLRIVNQVSSTGSLSFGTAYLWPGGTPASVTQSLSAVDLISFYCDGVSMLGTVLRNFK